MITIDTHPKEVVDNIYSNRVAAELIFSAPHGSVIGWDVGADDKAFPVTDLRAKYGARQEKISSAISEGVNLFAGEFTSLTNKIKLVTTPDFLISPIIDFVASGEWKSNQLIISQVTDFDNWTIRHAGETGLLSI